MNHSIDFFRDEVRNGFYIPTAVKQAWASCLDVLKEVDRICIKYGIRYFADWGSFLGAVRHGGFVPWDDDLDICMLRDDYTKFRKVADKELPKHYVIHDYERKEDHWLFLSRVVSNAGICFDEDYMAKHYNFPWLATVDIFVKDYLYMDEVKEKERDKDVMFLITLADGIREGTFDRNTSIYHLQKIKEKYHTGLPDIGRTRDLCVALYRLAEKEMAKVNPEETDTVGQIFPWILKGGKGQPKSYYEKIIRLPFEDTTIPVPACYNTVLASRYGNYNEIHKVWDGHMYPFFEGQKADLEKINGAPLPDHVFDRKMLEKPEKDYSNSLKAIAEECLVELRRLESEVEKLPNEELLTSSQQLAIDLGTLIEQVKGEKRGLTKAVVGTLEEYCEAVFKCFQIVSGSGAESTGNKCSAKCETAIKNLGAVLGKVCKTTESYIVDRKEVLFLPIGYREWKGLEKIYRRISDADIYVVPLPVFTKNPLGQVEVNDEKIREGLQIDKYPKDIIYTDWQEYDISQHSPDVIFIQNPYDADNPYLTVPPRYYAVNLRKFTEKLVFIPFKDTTEFGEEDGPDIYNLKHYAASPGVIYSDITVVQSENIKKHYVNALVKYAGEETAQVWEKKIILREEFMKSVDRSCQGSELADSEDKPTLPEDKEDKGENIILQDKENAIEKVGMKKQVLFCIGANELTEHKECMIKAVQDRFEILRQNSDKIETTVFLYPSDRKLWREVETPLSDKLFDMIDVKVREGMNFTEIAPSEADEEAERYDAYYGSSSPLVPAFIMKKKPVMIANYDCL